MDDVNGVFGVEQSGAQALPRSGTSEVPQLKPGDVVVIASVLVENPPTSEGPRKSLAEWDAEWALERARRLPK